MLVWTPSPSLSSAIVTALVSLTAPLAFGGDFRPYINAYDSDIDVFTRAINSNSSSGSSSSSSSSSSGYGSGSSSSFENSKESSSKESTTESNKSPCLVLGITNPILLRLLSNVDAALLIPNPESYIHRNGKNLMNASSSGKFNLNLRVNTNTSSNSSNSSVQVQVNYPQSVLTARSTKIARILVLLLYFYKE